MFGTLLFKFYKQPSQRHSSVHLDEIAHNVGPFDLILVVCFDTNMFCFNQEIPYWSSSTGYMLGSVSKKSPWEEKRGAASCLSVVECPLV